MKFLHCKHPFFFVRDILRKTPTLKAGLWSYSIGTHIDSYSSDKAFVRHFSANELTEQAVNDIFATSYSQSEMEIGISQLIVGGRDEIYLPMLDLVGRPTRERIDSICRNIRDNILFCDRHAVYDSGNSYHVYFNTLAMRNKYLDMCYYTRTVLEIDAQWISEGGRNRLLRWTSNNKGPIIRAWVDISGRGV